MATLRAKAPVKGNKRAKVMIHGEPGTWKTSLLCKMSRNYIIDTERGTDNDQYVDMMLASGSRSVFINQLDEVIVELRALMSTPKHGFLNVSIDPITVPYYEEGDRAIVALAKGSEAPADLADASTFQRHMNSAKLKVKRILRLCKLLDMNVWVVCHSKSEWKDSKQTGRLIPDFYEGARYDFDLILFAYKLGDQRMCRVEKSREAGFPEGDTFPFTYEEIISRYGRDVIGQEPEARELATDEQIVALRAALEPLKDNGADVIAKMMKSEDVTDVADLSAKLVQQALDHYTKAPVA